MPSDNFEKIFRDKVDELQHTPPPPYTWAPEKSWDKLAPLLQPKPQKRRKGLYWGIAAGLLLMLMAGLSVWQFAAVAPDNVLVLRATNEKPTQTGSRVGVQNPLPEVAKVHLAPTRENTGQVYFTEPKKRPLAPKPDMVNTTAATKQATIGEQKESLSPAMPKNGSMVPEPAQMVAQATGDAAPSPFKITVILGAKTLARQEALATAETEAASTTELMAQANQQKKRKLRLRIQRPEPTLPDQLQLASNQPPLPEFGLSARIKF